MVQILFGRKSPGRIGSLELDAILNEHQKFANNITNFPIESGSNISDHIIQAPEEVEIEGFVTNSPVPYTEKASELFASYTNNLKDNFSANQDDRVLNAYLTLLAMAGYKAPGKAYKFNELVSVPEMFADNLVNGNGYVDFSKGFYLVEILTSIRLYTDMALVTLDIPRDAKTGDTIRFKALFRKVNTVETLSIARTPDKVSEKNASADRAPEQTAEPKGLGEGGTRRQSKAFMDLVGDKKSEGLIN